MEKYYKSYCEHGIVSEHNIRFKVYFIINGDKRVPLEFK